MQKFITANGTNKTMYKVLKVKKNDSSYEILVQHPDHKIKLWLSAEYVEKDKDMKINWRDYSFNWRKNSEIVRMFIQANGDELCDAAGSALCYLEKYKFITIDENYNVIEEK